MVAMICICMGVIACGLVHGSMREEQVVMRCSQQSAMKNALFTRKRYERQCPVQFLYGKGGDGR